MSGNYIDEISRTNPQRIQAAGGVFTTSWNMAAWKIFPMRISQPTYFFNTEEDIDYLVELQKSMLTLKMATGSG
jgi:hypothetical protein